MNTIHMLQITMRMGEAENTIYPVLLQYNANLVLIDCGYIPRMLICLTDGFLHVWQGTFPCICRNIVQ